MFGGRGGGQLRLKFKYAMAAKRCLGIPASPSPPPPTELSCDPERVVPNTSRVRSWLQWSQALTPWLGRASSGRCAATPSPRFNPAHPSVSVCRPIGAALGEHLHATGGPRIESCGFKHTCSTSQSQTRASFQLHARRVNVDVDTKAKLVSICVSEFVIDGISASLVPTPCCT